MRTSTSLMVLGAFCFSLSLAAIGSAEPQTSEQGPQESKETAAASDSSLSMQTSTAGEQVDSATVLGKVRESLRDSRLSAAVQEKILASVREALQDGRRAIRATVKRQSADGPKAAEDGEATETYQIEISVVDGDGQEQRTILERLGTWPVPQLLRQKPQLQGTHETDSDERYVIGVALKLEGRRSEAGSGESQQRLTVVLDEVFEDSPAAKSGLKSGDIVVAVNGKKITEADRLIDMVQAAGKRDESLSMEVMRGEDLLTKIVKPIKKSPLDAPTPNEAFRSWANSFKGGNVLPKGWNSTLIIPDAGRNKEIEELKEQLGDVRRDLRELKELLEGLKKN